MMRTIGILCEQRSQPETLPRSGAIPPDANRLSSVLVRVPRKTKQGGCTIATLLHRKQYLVDSISLQDAIHMLCNAICMLREKCGKPGGYLLQLLGPLLHGCLDIRLQLRGCGIQQLRPLLCGCLEISPQAPYVLALCLCPYQRCLNLCPQACGQGLQLLCPQLRRCLDSCHQAPDLLSLHLCPCQRILDVCPQAPNVPFCLLGSQLGPCQRSLDR